jgi:hypothetical protein
MEHNLIYGGHLTYTFVKPNIFSPNLLLLISVNPTYWNS